MSEEALTKAEEIIDGVLRESMGGLFGECSVDEDGTYRSQVTHLGEVDGYVTLEAAIEKGFKEAYEYCVVHFHAAIAANVPEDALPDLMIALGALNHTVNAGAYPGFGCYSYYDPLNRVYLTYRLPVNPEDPAGAEGDVRYAVACIYEQLEAFEDYVMLTLTNPGMADMKQYLDYLKEKEIAEKEAMNK